MKKRVVRIETEKLSISLPNAMAAWLRRDAERRLTTVSAIIKDVLMDQFRAAMEGEKRHPPRKSRRGSPLSDCAGAPAK